MFAAKRRSPSPHLRTVRCHTQLEPLLPQNRATFNMPLATLDFKSTCKILRAGKCGNENPRQLTVV